MRYLMHVKIASAWLCLVIAGLLSACGGTGGVSPQSSSAVAGDNGAGRAAIQGVPRASVAVGQSYSFQPVVSNLSSGSVTFSATNLPSWLSLNASTGRVTGTPSEADIGTYSGLILRASDGSSQTTLGPFTITVSAQGSGTASLSWMPPTTNSDGSALTDLVGFVVMYGESPAELTNTIEIDNPSVTTYVVESLIAGTWYFTAQAQNSRGARSEPSGVASKTIS